MKNIPILTFIPRYWLLILALTGAVLLTLHDGLFARIGALIYAPSVVLGAALLNVLVTHLWFRETIDKETHDGTFLAEWQALDARTRITLTVVIRCAVFVGTAIILASLAK